MTGIYADSGDYTWPIGSETAPAPIIDDLTSLDPARLADLEDGCTAGFVIGDNSMKFPRLIAGEELTGAELVYLGDDGLIHKVHTAPDLRVPGIPPAYDLSVFSEKIAAALQAIDRRLSKIEGYVDGSEIRVMYERGIGK